MSWQATTWVIEHSKHKGSALLTMLMIANCANESGTNAWPGKNKLARNTRMSVRQVDRIINRLEASGELRVTRSTGHHPNHYAFPLMAANPDKVTGLAKDTTLSQLSPTNPDKVTGLAKDTTLSQLSPTNPDKSDTNPVTAMSPDPLVEQSNEKSEKKKDAAPAEWTPEKNTHSASIAAKATRYAKPRDDRPAIITRIGELTPNESTGKPIYPARALWPQFVATFGDEWDDERLVQRHTLWLTRGHKPTNWAWALEWYVNEPKSNTAAKPAAPYDPDYQAIVADYGDYYYVEAANHDGGTSRRYRTAEAFAHFMAITVEDVLKGNGGTREGTHWKTVEECPHHEDTIGGGNRPITAW